MYRSNFYEGSSNFKPNLFIDISNSIKIKIKALQLFKSEIQRKGNLLIELVQLENRRQGIANGFDYAESFKVIKFCI